jgi:hypothetical protein
VSDHSLQEREQRITGLQQALSERDHALLLHERAVADKEEEISAEIERRLTLSAAHLDLIAEHRVLGMKVDELTQQLAAAEARAQELATLIEATEAQWTGERAVIEAQYGETVTRIENEKRRALDQAEEALNATAMQLKQAHDEDKKHFDTSIGALKSELELKDIEARSLASERKELADQLNTLRGETLRLHAEKEQAHAKAIAKLEEQHRADKAALAQIHAAEQTRIDAQHADALVALREQHAGEMTRVQELHASELARNRDQHAIVAFELEEARRAVDNAKATSEQLVAEKRALEQRLVASEREAAVTRGRFVAHLEQGMAMFAAPPAADKPEHGSEEERVTAPHDVAIPPRD